MAKRWLTVAQIRELIQARITKGDAFRMTNEAYLREQERIRAELHSMTIDQIKQAYPQHTYDL